MSYHIYDIPYSSFTDYAFAISAQDNAFWFDSGIKKHPYGRYSFVGCDPYKIYHPDEYGMDIFEALKADMSEDQTDHDIPFMGGFSGFFSYDFGLKLLGLEVTGDVLVDMPDYYGGLYDACLYADHHAHKAGLIITDKHPEYSADRRKEYFFSLFEQPFHKKKNHIAIKPIGSKEQYKEAVETTRDYIQNGNIFQANIARYFKGDIPKEFCSLSYFSQLRDVNSAPFGCYINGQDFSLMSSSPERFLKIEKGHIETRPIKGTLSDHFGTEQLEQSTKDRAENIMIVDMLRNDLAKSSKTGTVKVPELCAIETYEGLHHMVSSVQSEKDDGYHNADVLKNALPGGSVTGAPKKHACEIISALEGTRRGAYCGSAGYMSFSGSMDTNILIRTVYADQKHIAFGAGCGITYESNAQAEYEESVLKARKIIQSFEASS